MCRRNVAPGSLAAVLAAFCVLSPAAAATVPAGFSGLLLDQPRCCLPAAAGERITPGITPGAEGPAAGMVGPGGRAAGTGTRLAQASETQPQAPPAEPAQKPPDATELPREPGKMPETPDGGVDDSFEGSPKPAGPDLSVSEERELISRGWE